MRPRSDFRKRSVKNSLSSDTFHPSPLPFDAHNSFAVYIIPRIICIP